MVMKKKDIQALHLKTREELTALLKILDTEIAKSKMDMLTGKIKNLNEVRGKMKDKARMLTIIGEKGERKNG